MGAPTASRRRPVASDLASDRETPKLSTPGDRCQGLGQGTVGHVAELAPTGNDAAHGKLIDAHVAARIIVIFRAHGHRHGPGVLVKGHGGTKPIVRRRPLQDFPQRFPLRVVAVVLVHLYPPQTAGSAHHQRRAVPRQAQGDAKPGLRCCPNQFRSAGRVVLPRGFIVRQHADTARVVVPRRFRHGQKRAVAVQRHGGAQARVGRPTVQGGAALPPRVGDNVAVPVIDAAVQGVHAHASRQRVVAGDMGGVRGSDRQNFAVRRQADFRTEPAADLVIVVVAAAPHHVFRFQEQYGLRRGRGGGRRRRWVRGGCLRKNGCARDLLKPNSRGRRRGRFRDGRCAGGRYRRGGDGGSSRGQRGRQRRQRIGTDIITGLAITVRTAAGGGGCRWWWCISFFRSWTCVAVRTSCRGDIFVAAAVGNQQRRRQDQDTDQQQEQQAAHHTPSVGTQPRFSSTAAAAATVAAAVALHFGIERDDGTLVNGGRSGGNEGRLLLWCGSSAGGPCYGGGGVRWGCLVGLWW